MIWLSTRHSPPRSTGRERGFSGDEREAPMERCACERGSPMSASFVFPDHPPRWGQQTSPTGSSHSPSEVAHA
jgi:hypothetical protein